MTARGNWTATVDLQLDDAREVRVEVECCVTGAYRTTRIAADPLDSHEAEYPEIEPVRAEVLREFVVKSRSDLPLSSPSDAEHERLMDALARALADQGCLRSTD